MTNIDGHRFYDQNFGHGQSGLSTKANPTWQISMTKTIGRRPNSAQSSKLFYMGLAQQSDPFIYFLDQLWLAKWAKPIILAFLFLGWNKFLVQ